MAAGWGGRGWITSSGGGERREGDEGGGSMEGGRGGEVEITSLGDWERSVGLGEGSVPVELEEPPGV